MDLLEADRVWFLSPCDVNAPFWVIPMEKTKPEWPGLYQAKEEIARSPSAIKMIEETIKAKSVVVYHHDESHPIPPHVIERFSIKSQIQVVIHPEASTSWIIGVHHCANKREYTETDIFVFNSLAHHISERLSNAILTNSLSEKEKLFQACFNNPTFGMAAMKPDSTWIEANNTICKMLGYTHNEFVKKTWADLIHSDELPKFLEKFDQLISGDVPHYVIEQRLMRNDGTSLPTRCVIQGSFKPNGEIDYIIATIENLYAQHKIESTLSLYRQQVQSQLKHSSKIATLNKLNTSIAIITIEGKIQLVNTRATELIEHLNVISISNGRLIGKSGNHPKLMSSIENAIKKQESVDIILSDNQSEKCWVSISPIQTEDLENTPHHSQCALLVLHAPDNLDKVKTEFLRQCYGLTETEAQVAEALALGSTPEEYASKASVKITTVRTQVRSILNKVGVRRLTDVTRILTGVPSLRE